MIYEAEKPMPNSFGTNNAFRYPPLGLLYLISNLPQNFKDLCIIIDADAENYSIDECVKKIIEISPDILGVSVFTITLYTIYKIIDEIKKIKNDIKIILGGPHVTIYSEETLKNKNVDYILTGLCENTFPKFIELFFETKSRGIEKNNFKDVPGLWYKTKDNKYIKPDIMFDNKWSVKNIKFPDRNLIKKNSYYTLSDNEPITTMITSYGCPFKCTFCDVPIKKFIPREIDDLILEIKSILDIGIKQIHFMDDCFNLDRDRVIKFCNRIIDNKMDFKWSFRGRVKPCDKEMADLLYKAGCRRVQLGIEATEQEIIDLIRKNIKITDILEVLKIYKSSGIITLGYFIIGFPTQTLEDCKISFKKMQQFGFDYIYMTKLVPYPKTIIYEQILEQKLLDKDYWYDFILNPTPNYILPNWHPYCSKDELNDLLIKNYRSFYISPKFILKELKRTKSLNQLLKKIKVSLSLNFLKQN